MADRPMRAEQAQKNTAAAQAAQRAAAIRLTIPRIGTAARLSRRQWGNLRQVDWQRQAWDYYDTTPELRFVANWLGQASSQCRLYIGRIDPDGSSDPVPVEDEKILKYARTLYGGLSRQPEMLKRMAVQLSVCGETMLCHGYLPDPDDVLDTGRREVWHVASTDELTGDGQDRRLRLDTGTEFVPLPVEADDDSFVIKIWNPHARRAWESDAPTRALLGTCAEITGLTSHINANIDSRLAGAGMLTLSEDAFPVTPTQVPVAVPDTDLAAQTAGFPFAAAIASDGTASMTLAAAPGTASADGTSVSDDPFVDRLTEAMMTSISDRDSAAAVVPLVIRVAGPVKDAVRYDTFTTELSEKAVTMREAAIKRFAIGADVPPEILLGLGDNSNHWNAWKISADSITIHVEPLMATLCDAITTHFLQPLLAADKNIGPEAATQYAFWFDTSRLADETTREGGAIDLFDRGLVKGSAAVRAAGYGTDDMPDGTERAQLLLTQLATKGVDPAVVAPYLKALGVLGFASNTPTTTPVTTESGDLDAVVEGDTATLIAALGSHTTTDHQFLAAHACVLRALEIAGKRLLTKASRARHQHADTPAWELHTRLPYDTGDIERMLTGAFDLADEIFHDDPDVTRLIRVSVDTALSNRRPYSPAMLRSHMTLRSTP